MPFQKDVARPESERSAQVRLRLREAMAALEKARAQLAPARAVKPLPEPREIDPALLPRPAVLNEKQLANLAELRWRSGKHLDFRAFNRHGTLNYLAGMMLEPPAEAIPANQTPEEATARRFLTRNKALLRLDDPDSEFVLQRRQEDALGYTQLHFSQAYQGLPVWPAGVTVQTKPGGHVSLFTGNYIPTPGDVRRRPGIEAAEAWESAREIVGLRRDQPVHDSQLIVYAPQDADPQLAYKIDVHGTMAEHWTVIVDAVDGEVINHYNHVCTAAVQGTGTDVSGNQQSIPLWQHNDGFFYMVDTSQPMFDATSNPPFLQNSRGVIKIVDANNSSLGDRTSVTSMSGQARQMRGSALKP